MGLFVKLNEISLSMREHTKKDVYSNEKQEKHKTYLLKQIV